MRLAVAAVLMMAALPAAASPIHRIVAVGDLHGDFSAWRDIARAAKLVDADGRWIGGDTVLVQTGDVVDRGPDSLKLVQELMRLQGEAPRAHGQVITLVGNHEAMNMTGDLRYVSDADFAAYVDNRSLQRREATYKVNRAEIEAAYRQHDPAMGDDAIKQAWIHATPLGKLEHQVAWRPDGRIGRWVAGNPAIVLLDGNLFLHGGISAAYVTMPMAEINARVAAALRAQSTDPAAIINDPEGPLWYRGLVSAQADAATVAPGAVAAAADIAPEAPIADQLDRLLPAFGAKRIIIGHTPILSGISVLYDGRLICIDTGISAFFGGQVTWLEILDGTPVAHTVTRSSSSTK